MSDINDISEYFPPAISWRVPDSFRLNDYDASFVLDQHD